MKLSQKQRTDLDSCLYFLPNNCAQMKQQITDDDIRAYFNWSDKGDKSFLNNPSRGCQAIRWGKTYRELFITDMLRDLDKIIFVWEIAYENPDLPRSVLASLGRTKQFNNWREIFDSNDWNATAHKKAQQTFPNDETSQQLFMGLFERVTAAYEH